MYSIGDYVIKSNTGVCQIADIVHLDMEGIDKNRLFYLMVPLDSRESKLYIPTDKNTEEVRAVISEEEAWALIKHIPEIEEVFVENDKLRELKYKEVIKSCDLEAVVGIIKSMYNRKRMRNAQGKKNTSVDERYFKLAEEMLYSELAFAMKKNKDDMCQLIKDTINNS